MSIYARTYCFWKNIPRTLCKVSSVGHRLASLQSTFQGGLWCARRNSFCSPFYLLNDQDWNLWCVSAILCTPADQFAGFGKCMHKTFLPKFYVHANFEKTYHLLHLKTKVKTLHASRLLLSWSPYARSFWELPWSAILKKMPSLCSQDLKIAKTDSISNILFQCWNDHNMW